MVRPPFSPGRRNNMNPFEWAVELSSMRLDKKSVVAALLPLALVFAAWPQKSFANPNADGAAQTSPSTTPALQAFPPRSHMLLCTGASNPENHVCGDLFGSVSNTRQAVGNHHCVQRLRNQFRLPFNQAGECKLGPLVEAVHHIIHRQH